MKPIESNRIALDRKIVLRFPDFEGFVIEYASNLSMTGMFVRSSQPQAAGTPVDFELRLEAGASLVRGRGWVVWARAEDESPDRPAGMGIEFTELDQKSRRLVRWLISSQLGEDVRPYDVHAEAARSAAVEHRAATAARGRRRWLAAAVALLVLAAWAAMAYLTSGNEVTVVDRTPPDGSPADPQAKRPVAAVAGSESSSLSAAEATPVTTVPSAADSEASAFAPEDDTTSMAAERESPERAIFARAEVVSAVEAAVRGWAQAWSAQDVEAYLEHYASGFIPAGGLSQAQWRAQRRQRVTAPRSLRVAVTRLETRVLSDREAQVSFLQTYRSDTYTDTVDKVLELELDGGHWKIRRELAD